MHSLSSEKEFFKKYQIDEKEYRLADFKWEQLSDIYNAYLQEMPQCRALENYFLECLKDVDNVHSVITRLKDPEHVIEAIIRNKIKNKKLEINNKNYREVVTDLIKVKVLHLFKEDWESIHEYIIDKWTLRVKPLAYVREGDEKALLDRMRERGCDIQLHNSGYRSINYQAISSLDNKTNYVEIQVRTLFEEAWSDIDHIIRDSHDMDSQLLLQYLSHFHQIAGMADEMGSFLQKHLKDNQKKLTAAPEIQAEEPKLESTDKGKTSSDSDVVQPAVKEAINPTVDSLASIQHQEVFEVFDSKFEVFDSKNDLKKGPERTPDIQRSDILKEQPANRDAYQDDAPKKPEVVLGDQKDSYPKIQQEILYAPKDDNPQEQGDAQKFTLSKLKQAIQGISQKNPSLQEK